MPAARPKGRLPSLARALFGAARFELGHLWLKAYIRRHRGLAADALLAAAWDASRRHRALFAGGEDYDNAYGQPWRDKLLLRLLRDMEAARVFAVPKVAVLGLEHLRGVADRRQPTVVVTVHTPVDAVLNRVFAENGLPSSLIAADVDQPQHKARLLGLSGELEIIVRDADALLRTRRALAGGRLICACVDFTVRAAGSFYRDVFVSPALFDMARRLRISILYADTSVREDGTIEVAFGVPAAGLGAGAEERAADFVRWLGEARGDRRDLRVLRWQGKEAGHRGLTALGKPGRSS